MSKKTDAIYYENYLSCVDCACRSARLIHAFFKDFDTNRVEEEMEKMHAIEREADKHRHAMSKMLGESFITPIERDDMMSISHNLDEIVDALDDVLMRIYMCDIKEIKEDAILLTEIAIKACDLLKEVMLEFENFKRSKTIKENLVAVNTAEDEGDRIFLHAMRKLHVEEHSVIDIVSWRDIYRYLERCIDSCEHAADVIELAMMKNS